MAFINPNLFGEPRKGIRRFRIPIIDWAILDTALTVMLAFFLSHHYSIRFLPVFIVLLLLAMIFHRLAHVRIAL